MSKLFSPLRLRGLEIRNRVFLSPMCQYSAPDGMPGQWHLAHYGARAAGGAGLVMVEATAVAPEGRITPFDLGLWSDQQAEAMRPLTSFIRAQGAVAGIQLGHAGRKASCDQPWRGGKPLLPGDAGWQPLAPGSLPFSAQSCQPREMDDAAIDTAVEQFAAAAQRALDAGFQVAEVHMAHGYLLHEFLSPLTNRRNDSHGGDFDRRIHFPLRVALEVREVWPEELPVFVRISATDWVEGGWDLAQSVELAHRLKSIGIDLVDVSSGGLAPEAVPPAAPGFQTTFAATIRNEVNIPTGTVGLITEAAQAEHILVTGQADAVLLGRELLRNPYWPLHAARVLGDDAAWPPQYQRAKL